MGNLLAIISPGSIVGIVDTILNTIVGIYVGPYVWGLCDIFFLVLFVFETIYKMFAGITPIKINGEMVNQDPVLYLINTRVVQEMFFSILILSFILLVIFTIFAITKNIYTDKPKPVGEILSSSIKAMLMYLLVPVATIVCLIVGNVVLIAIDGATKTPGAASMGDQLFMSAAYNANKLRGGADWEKTALLWTLNTAGALNPKEMYKDTYEYQHYVSTMAKHGIEVNKFGAETFNVTDWEEVANAVDRAYVNGIIGILPGPTSKFLYQQVMIYYDILEINFIMVWAGGAFMIGALGKITWGLISRMFKMTAYFVISPALMATFPIDGGKALGNWRGEMVKNGTMALCSVGTINIVLAILPAFANVKVFNNFILDGIVTLMLDIVAICGAEKLIGTVSSWFGTGDALAEGKAVKQDVQSKTQGTMKKIGGMVAATKGGFDAAIKHGGNPFVGALSGFMSQTSVGKTWSDTQKMFKDAGDAGANQYKDVATRSLRRFGGVDEDKVAEYEDYDEVEKLKKKYKATTTNEWNGSQEVNVMTRAQLDTLAATNPAAYKTEMKHAKEVLEIDDYGERVYFREEAALKKREEKHANEQGYQADFTRLQRLQDEQDRAHNAYTARETALAGGIALDSLSGTFASDIRDALLANDYDALFNIGLAASAAGDMNAHNAVDSILTKMNDQIVDNLNQMHDAASEADVATREAATTLEETLARDDKKMEFAQSHGLVDGAGNIDFVNLNAHLSTLATAIDSNSQALKSERAHLTHQKAEASSRHMSGTTTTADRNAMRDYRDSHSSK